MKGYRDFYPHIIRRQPNMAAVIEYRDAGTTRNGTPYLEGRAVPYKTWANVGAYQEMIWPSCFMESLQREPNLPLLLFHDSRSFPVGIAERWTHKPDGLYGLWKMDSNDRGREAARQASIGHLGLSIGFQPDPEGTDYRADADSLWLTRLAARLLEVSLTPTPAYVDAKVTNARL